MFSIGRKPMSPSPFSLLPPREPAPCPVFQQGPQCLSAYWPSSWATHAMNYTSRYDVALAGKHYSPHIGLTLSPPQPGVCYPKPVCTMPMPGQESKETLPANYR
jgi:hypothetical protein